mmetsp:Transcript_35574/g.70330  ORF Transcript_35574/g.70330 Transcript_35574/m.70330 type:complete len:87 (+) Transcript_35574:786-1046(+)
MRGGPEASYLRLSFLEGRQVRGPARRVQHRVGEKSRQRWWLGASYGYALCGQPYAALPPKVSETGRITVSLCLTCNVTSEVVDERR